MMPRRCTEVVQLPMPPKKKSKVLEVPPSLDVSFFDDEALPPGIVFSDIQQNKWRIGKPIGRGSFGRIYLASDEVEKEVTKLNARYVVKIEPHTNGPLFVEIHCLIRSAQACKVKSWRQQMKQKRLGMPIYIASGSFTDETSGIKYRFLVLPRFDIDLHKIIARTKVLDLRNVLVLAIQILDVLEYLHNQGYTHSDIKSSNLMLGFDGMKLGKVPAVKHTPSFQKEIKEVSVLNGKQRRVKNGKNRMSYYDDEDYIVKDYKSSPHSSESDKRLANVKKKLRRILSERDNRTLHRHHAFNLRQLSNYVNYEDLNSSVCSDQSYQKLIDDFGNNLMRTSEEFCEDSIHNNYSETQTLPFNELYGEAILSQSNGQIYLLDYGLASKFLDSNGKHKEFGMDARKAHDGTLEYSSRDSHIGAHSRRSDLETLGYNLLDWLTGTLPWKTTEVLAEPDLVHALKKNFMSDIKLLLKTCFKTEFYPQFMEKYLQYVTSLDFTEKPDYDYCRSLFKSELLKNGYDKDICLNFAETFMASVNRNNKLFRSKIMMKKNTSRDFVVINGIKKAFERENVYSLENDLKLELLKQTLNSSSDGVRKPCTSRNFFISDADLVARLKKSLMPHDIFGKKLSPKNLRSKKKTVQKRRGVKKHRNSIGKFGNFMGSARQFTWAEILAGNPEDIIRKERNATVSEDDESTCKYRIRKLSNSSSDNNVDNVQSPLMQKDYLQGLNPTYAMKEVIASFKKRASGKNIKEPEENPEGLEGYTPAMIRVYRMKEKREAKENLEAAKQNCGKKEVMTQQRRTRSNKKVPNKTVPATRTTRKKISNDSSNEKSDSELDQNKEKSKPKKNKTTTGKKTVQIVEEIKPAVKPKTKSRPSLIVPNNRRRLRSSRRTPK
ncbi:unnamed protein product [Chilo suppressalis]|uniref:non-specific serine/threonine protein kinase n=1 Tax=Chilo suppressalis TaxID=168631 RepID=A0ABN8L9W1_CHISP|nr:unnamed protein product [Chilo suppressalis]